jgi:hypothetical protein
MSDITCDRSLLALLSMLLIPVAYFQLCRPWLVFKPGSNFGA